jgi:N,N'-diacetyllegionaminate synthase
LLTNGPTRSRVLFLITARGGSKGLPGKNLAAVGGIPLVGRAARLGRAAARALGPHCRVVCSTDDERIAAAAREWGAEVPFLRPAELASDRARSIDVAFHALDVLQTPFDALVLLQPTSPLTDLQDVLGAFELHRQTGRPVVSVCPSEHPAEWLYTIDGQGMLGRLLATEASPDQRQQARRIFRTNGAVYVSTPADLRRFDSFVGPDTRAFVMPAERSMDIDTAVDLDAARTALDRRAIPSVAVGSREIGPGHPCFVIAEAGVNHNGDPALARALVDAAVSAGADAVKFQTFRADRLVTADAPKAAYQLETTDAGESQFDMLRRLELDEAAHLELSAYCAARGIIFFSTPFDEESADLLASLDLPAIKIPSGEITNLPFLRHVGRQRQPVILSTGMAGLREVCDAVDAVQEAGRHSLVLLHCVSNYPADPADANLRAMATLRRAFGVPVGFSDHMMGDAIALAAVALGASVIEKHLTLDAALPGPDHRASMEPEPFRQMVQRIREVESGLGNGVKEPKASEAGVARVARKSLVAARSIPAGTVLDAGMIIIRRPATGISPDQLPSVIGRRTRVDVPEGMPLTYGMLA